MSENSQSPLSNIGQIFKASGQLANAIEGFSERKQQLEMALAIEATI